MLPKSLAHITNSGRDGFLAGGVCFLPANIIELTSSFQGKEVLITRK